MNAEEFFEQQEKKEKFKKRIQLSAIPLYYAIYIPLMVLCWRAESKYIFHLLILAIAPILYYFLLFKTEMLFNIQYMFNLDIEDPQPSAWYYMMSYIAAYAIMVIGIFLPLLAYVYALVD
ncbi:MAG: hypothetical protein Q4G33_12555 [bacterium]|nr:hypothetical protein [bacterium]